MKTVSGKVVSIHPISLSKAAKLISRFTASDNEASPAYAAYLRRTSAAFNELSQLHKEYNISVGESPGKKRRSRGVVVTQGTPNHVTIDGKGVKREGVHVDSLNIHGDGDGDGDSNKPNVADVAAVKSKKKKGSDGGMSIIDKDTVNVGKPHEKKHKKKLSHEAEERENLRNIETEATDKKASRKRKHEMVADGELDGSHEAVKSKKKKIQTVG